jgi:hypothetical protein
VSTVGDNIGGCAGEHHPAAVLAGTRAEVDEPVGVGHHGLVMLDDDYRVAGGYDLVQQCQELVDIREVQAGGRLVQHICRDLLRHLDGQLEPLSFSAGQGGERLTQTEAAAGVSNEEWWFARSAMMEQVAPDFAKRFPMVIRLESDREFRPPDETMSYLEREVMEAFEAGLAVLLDGIEATMTKAGL